MRPPTAPSGAPRLGSALEADLSAGVSGVVAEAAAPVAAFTPLPAAPSGSSPAAAAAVIALGCAALLMMGIQPLVLGALQSAGRLSLPAMGQAATVETLAIGAVSAALAARVRHRRLKAWGLLGCLLMVAADAAGLFAGGGAFVASRGLAGAAAGVIVWIAAGLITRRADASRINAVFVGAQALSQGAVAALIPLTIGPSLGANSGLWVLGGFAAVTAPLLLVIPDRFAEARAEAQDAPRLSLASAAGLAATLLMMAGIVGVWVYVEPIARSIGMAERTVSFAIAASLAAQVAGALLLVVVDRWIRPASGLVAVAALFLCVVAVFAWSHAQAAFLLAAVAFGVLWTFALALPLPLLLAADPSRRAPLYGPAATLLGASLGPLLAGTFATPHDIRPALAISAVLFALAAAAVLVSAKASAGRRAG